MAQRKMLEFQCIPGGDLRCCEQVMDLHGKKTPGVKFVIEIAKAELTGGIQSLEKYCDGNPFHCTIRSVATKQEVAFHAKNDYEFTCDARHTDSGKTRIEFIKLPFNVSRSEIKDLDLLWDIMLSSACDVILEPSQIEFDLEEDADEDTGKNKKKVA